VKTTNYFLMIIYIGLSWGLFNQSLEASPVGLYMGGQLGWDNVHQGHFIAEHLDRLVKKAFPDKKIDNFDEIYHDTGMAERFFVGYQFNPYFALETGYTHFNSLEVNTNRNATISIFHTPVNMDLATHAFVQTFAIDFVAKGILPISERFSVYGKGGLAYLNANGKVRISANAPGTGEAIISGNPSMNVVYPTVSIGLNYDLSQHVSADLSWNRIQQLSHRSFPSTDFVALGFIYHF